MIVPIHGPARGTSTPGAFKPRRAFSMPVSSFPRPHSSWHDRAESATPDGSDPTLSNNWVPAERRIQSISGGWIIGLWRAAFGVATERQLGAIEHFGLWVSPCGLAFFEPMLAGDADFYLDLHAASHSGQYDAVCAFHVIEHVTDPLGFGRDLVQCTRPGGRIYIAVPV